jgi:hypothetical protein
MAQGCMQDGEELRQRPKSPVWVTKEDMHGLEAPGLTQRSHGHRLEHLWEFDLVPMSMNIVNGNGGGG